MSKVCAVQTRPSMLGSPLDTVKSSRLILPFATACMQALLPPNNRAATSSSTRQNSHQGPHNGWLWGWQTASSRTLDEVLKPLKYLQRRVLLLLCGVIEGEELWGRPNHPDRLTGFLLEKESTKNKGWSKQIKLFVFKMLIFGWGRVFIWVLRVEKCVGVGSWRILIREELKSHLIHHLL